MRPCPTCRHPTPEGNFCVRCGAPLSADLAHSRHRPQFAAAPGQRRRVPWLISTLFPQLPRHSERHFRAAVLLGGVLVLGLTAERLFGVAMISAALLMPLITLLYFYDVDVYRDAPAWSILWTVGWGVLTGVGAGLLTQAWAPTGAALIDRASSDQVLTGGLLVPALSVIVMLIGPLVLLPYRRYNDVLDGATFGSASAVSFTAAQVIVVGAGVIQGGLRPPGAVLPWAARLLALAVATPVLTMSAVGFAAGALWLRYRAPVGDRRALGPLGRPETAIALALALVLLGTVTETFAPVGLWLAWLVVLDLVALSRLRETLHVGLLEEAGEREIGPATRCVNCGAQTATHTFCGNCGIALRALPNTRPGTAATPSAPGSFRGRLSVGESGLARSVGALLLIAGGAVAALAVVLVATPQARQPRCRPGVVCGAPPPPVARVGSSSGYTGWQSAGLGYSLRFVSGQWTIASQSRDGVVLQSSDGISQIAVQGAPAPPAAPGALIAARRSVLSGALLGLSPDPGAADQLLGPNVGLTAGLGAVYRATTNLPQAPDTPVSVAVMASRTGPIAIVATVITPAGDPAAQAARFGQADDVLNSIQVNRARAVLGRSPVGAQAPAPSPGAGRVSYLGPAPGPRRLSFDLVLRVPGQRRMQRALAALLNPRSPQFRHFITPRQFGRRFGLSRRSLISLEGWLRAAGMRVQAASPQRTQLAVSADINTVRRLFSVGIGDYRDPAGHHFTGVRGTVRIPAALTSVVTGVIGLDTGPRFVAHDVPLTGLDPAAAAAAYGVTALHRGGLQGQGETIAVVSFSTFDPQDPAAFARQNHLRGPQIQVIPVDGGTTDTSGTLEANLDLDVIRAIAPRAHILFYEVPQSTRAYADVINRIVRQRRATIISSSWGQCELRLDPAERAADSRVLAAAVGAGVSAFIASGDQGAYDCQQSDLADRRRSVDWPAASANAVAVGGTRLLLGPGSRYTGEAAWEDQLSGFGGGGGVSINDVRPVWQRGSGVSGPWSTGHRQLPDVSAAADPGTPWSFYAYGSVGTEGGTSAAAPFWAAAMALVREYAARHGVAQLGYLNPILYALAGSPQRFAPFHDVTRGGNRFYPAGPGWDPATGLGSPDVYNLARDIVRYLRGHPAVCGARPCRRR
ncbi:MAG: protease pro-enzyme activation domain-containing protein [Solirubrobacteraceae bacterium]